MAIPVSFEDFTRRATKAHGNTYTYHEDGYKSITKLVTIVCVEHGPFQQVGTDHINGRGCSKCAHKRCAEKKTFTQSKFINKSVLRHGDKYDYSKSVYKSSTEHVCIICLTHGEFWQRPVHHLRGAGCPKCAKNHTMSKNEFLSAASQRHDGLFTYDMTSYKNMASKMIILCKQHGEFKQSPEVHLKGHGCPKCRDEKAGLRTKLTTDDFVRKSIATHGDTYDYTSANYKGMNTKVKIKCPKHGYFEQTPSKHSISGHGCPHCASSRGEASIRRFLEKMHVKFIQEKHLLGCRDVGNLRFDFVIVGMDNEILAAIEYHGTQHFTPVPFFGGERALAETQRRDQLKRDYCRYKCIPLLELSNIDTVQEQLTTFIKRVLNANKKKRRDAINLL